MTVQRDKRDEKIANDVPEGKQTPAGEGEAENSRKMVVTGSCICVSVARMQVNLVIIQDFTIFVKMENCISPFGITEIF